MNSQQDQELGAQSRKYAEFIKLADQNTEF